MEDLAATLILSFIITWTIGLTPPLLIRYAFLRRPMAKKPAIGTAAFFWFLNLIFFIAMGSTSKSHAALLLIAYVSYWILRKENKKGNPPIKSPIPKPLMVPNIQTETNDDSTQGSQHGKNTIEERLSELRQLYDKGLITSAVYEQKQAEILRQKL